MEQFDPGRLRRSVLYFSILGMVVLSTAVAAVGILPLQSRLSQEVQGNLAHALELRRIAVGEYLSRVRNIASQVTSRTVIRHKLVDYNQGRVDLDQLVAFSADKLVDAMNLSPEVLGITRLDRNGAEVVQVGLAMPHSFWPLPAEDSLSTLLGSPREIAGRMVLAVGAPIMEGDAREGTDIVVFDTESLRRIIADSAGLGQSGEIVLAGRGAEGISPFFPLRQATACGLSDRQSPLARSLGGEGSQHGAIAHACPEGGRDVVVFGVVPETDWLILARMAEDELLADVRRMTAWVVLASFVLMAVGVAGLALLLRPMTDHIMVRSKDLADQVRELEVAHRDLEEKTAHLARANAELERFAHIASHDLKEPLRTVVTYAQLLERNHAARLDPEAIGIIDMIVGSASRMRQLINDLLAYTEAGAAILQPVRVDVAEMIEVEKSNFRREMNHSGAVLTYGPLPAINGDRRQLATLFHHLIGNALKFRSPNRAPEIRITGEENDDGWTFAVEDNGIGVEPEYRDKIFIIFQRLHAIGVYPGTGVGLAICRRIVEAHGGRIRVEAGTDGGSRFVFNLPRI